MSKLPDNWTHVEGPFYIVRTQAGLKQALRHHGKLSGEDVRGYPRSYPALVCFSNGYSGSEWIRVDTVHLNTLLEKIEHQGKPPPPPPPPPPAPPPPPEVIPSHVLIKAPLHTQPTSELNMGGRVLVEANRMAVFEILQRSEVWGLISPYQLSFKKITSEPMLKEIGFPKARAVYLDDNGPIAWIDGPIDET